MLAWCGVFFALSVVGTWLALGYARQHQLVDLPGERRSHRVPTPRGGGIGLVLAIATAAVALAARFPEQTILLAAFVAALLLVAGIGWLDDHRPLPARFRLGVHALAALVLATAYWGVERHFGMAAGAFVAVLVLTNAWNFMDGIDGIAATQAALVGAAMAFANGAAWQWLALALVVAACGFLPFNLPRARIFLGDVGSGALGLTVAALLVSAGRGDPASWLLLLLPLSAFLVDTGLTLLRRIVRRERWWAAHVQHAYQRLAVRAGGHLRVTVGYAAWTIASILLMVVVRKTSPGFVSSVVFGWYIVAAALWVLAQRWAGWSDWQDKERQGQ